MPDIILTIILFLFMAIPSIVTTILLGMVIKKLKRMRQRRNATSDNKEVKSSTKYIIGTCITFYRSVIPLFAHIIWTKTIKKFEDAVTAILLRIRLFFKLCME